MEQTSTNGKTHTKRVVLSERQPRAGQIRTPTRPTDCHQEPSPAMAHHESLKPEGNLSIRDKNVGKQHALENKHISAITEDTAAGQVKRDSQVSSTSTASGKGKSKRKTHVGPWQLGRTLGKGATGRVRLAKHALTGESAAIKIVSKKSAALVQSTSMANVHKDDTAPAIAADVRTIPFGIEREVVIMKLIEHPNVIDLYDVWENRGELYLVLEYVQGGELFDYVSTFGALPEEEAVRLFRQIIAALSYCHRFNICHRDLKPENILIDANRNIKLADFGMAALQPTNRWLNTSCGSPHYAAPEIIHGYQYRGEIADIWSVGIILFAMLNGFLPFDGGDLPNTLRLVKKGNYYLPPTLSPEASDLIQRILQKHPEDRISMNGIWGHALIKKYEKYHASLVPEGKLAGPSPPLNLDGWGPRLTSRKDIDAEILRNLQTLWHGDKQEELIQRLLCEELNHEKLFYQALFRFREEQLENYPGDQLQYSTSDYHHAKKPTPKALKRGANAHGRDHNRRHSQFSIVSEEGQHKRESYYKKPGTAASTATKGSYDPYRSSRTPITGSSGDQSTTVVRRSSTASKQRNASNARSVRQATRLQDEIPGLPSFTSEELQQTIYQKQRTRSTTTSRSSLASSRHGRGVKKSASYKRQVGFQHQRQPSSGNAHDHTASYDADVSGQPVSREGNHSISETQSTPSMPTPQVTRPRKPASELDIKKPRPASQYWRDDARQVSNELGKICEEAFNRSSISSSEVSHTHVIDSPATSISTHNAAVTMNNDRISNRPLPFTPEQNAGRTALKELASTRRRIIETWDDADPDGLEEILANLDRRLAREREKLKDADNRTVSDPTHTSSKASYQNATTRPSTAKNTEISKNRGQDSQTRAASDPVKKTHAPNQDSTIRLVSPEPLSPAVSIEPLQIRKKSQVLMPLNSLRGASSESLRNNYERGGYDARFLGKKGLDTIEEDPKSPKRKGGSGSAASRKWSWLGKRATESQEDLPPTPPRKNSHEKKIEFDESGRFHKSGSQASSDLSKTKASLPDSEEMQAEVEKKRKWFQKMFKGRGKKTLPLEPSDHEILQDVDDETDSNGTSADDIRDNIKKVTRKNYPPAASVDATATANASRPIQINQNWLAKIFHIKPASRIICLQMSKAKARKEIVKILKEWRKYGLRDVVSERRAGGDVIRGRVDALNYLHLKPVHFHAYCFTVLEHGRKANLSIMKFTQEKGAASSFYKVVDTLETVLKDKSVLVTDPERKKGIEKSLKDARL